MAICGRCGGFNNTEEVCPECGLQPNYKEPVVMQDTSIIAPKLAELHIPRAYLGKRWSMDMFWSSHQGRKADDLVNILVNQMDKIHSIFASGSLPGKSVVIVAPAGFSKMIWAYSCMQYAISSKYSVAPILDTLEIKRLIILSAERPKTSILGVNYDDYIDSDVLFFTVTKTEYRKSSADVIAEIMDKRARRGKATIGISRFSLTELSQWDYGNSISTWREPIDPVDCFKIPAYITCL